MEQLCFCGSISVGNGSSPGTDPECCLHTDGGVD